MHIRITSPVIVTVYQFLARGEYRVSRHNLLPGMAFEVLRHKAKVGLDLFELEGLGWALLPEDGWVFAEPSQSAAMN